MESCILFDEEVKIEKLSKKKVIEIRLNNQSLPLKVVNSYLREDMLEVIILKFIKKHSIEDIIEELSNKELLNIIDYDSVNIRYYEDETLQAITKAKVKNVYSFLEENGFEMKFESEDRYFFYYKNGLEEASLPKSEEDEYFVEDVVQIAKMLEYYIAVPFHEIVYDYFI